MYKQKQVPTEMKKKKKMQEGWQHGKIVETKVFPSHTLVTQ